jgi:Mrp family chromosome partitioning ATPase
MAVGGQPQTAGDHVGVILVTSPSPAEGKTTTAVNLAAAFAETGRSVIIVNSDFRRPMAVSAVTDDRPPLPAGLAGIDRLDAAEFLNPTKVPGVDLLDLSPLGGTPGDLTRATLKMVGALEPRADVIVIDTPPLAVTTEALEFVPVAKVAVLIGRLGHTPTASAERAGELVRFGGAEQLAIALTDTGSGRLRKSSYYDYYRDQDETGRSRPKRGSGKGGERRRRTSQRTASAPLAGDTDVDPTTPDEVLEPATRAER